MISRQPFAGRLNHGKTWNVGRRVGGHRRMFPPPQSHGATADGCAKGIRGHLLDSAERSPVARFAGGVRSVGNGVWPLQHLVVGRNFEECARTSEKKIQPRGSIRPHGVVHRRNHRACPSLYDWGRKKGDPDEPEDHALGRSRGGFSTKIHLVCDGEGRPLNVELSAGQTHETRLFEDLWDSTEVLDQKRNYFVQPEALAGDKAYYSGAIISRLEADGVDPVIPKIGK